MEFLDNQLPLPYFSTYTQPIEHNPGVTFHRLAQAELTSVGLSYIKTNENSRREASAIYDELPV